MPTTAYSSQGTQLKVKISGVFTNIPGIVGLTGPSTQWAFENITNLGSTGFAEEVKPTTLTVRPVSFDMIIAEPANSAQEYLLISNNTAPPILEEFQEITSAGVPKTYGFFAYVSKADPIHATQKVGRYQIELTPSGVLTRT